MSYSFRPASRSQAKPLVGLYSESNGGKTFNALLLARGFVGPQGKIGMIETESGRGESYADPKDYPEFRGPDPDRNYDVCPIRDDFQPKNYGEAISAAEKMKFDALIIDSASHEWEGAGGVLAMAAENQAAGKKGPIVWQKPKLDHQRHFMLRFMQTSIPLVILNMRAKYPMEQIVKDGKKDWARSEKLDPKQADDILFEMFIHGWFSTADHKFHPTRLTGRGLDQIFKDGMLMTLDTGRQLAEWANGKGISTKNNGATSSAPETSLEDYLHDIENAIALEALRFKFEQAQREYKAAPDSLKKLVEAKDKRKAALSPRPSGSDEIPV